MECITQKPDPNEFKEVGSGLIKINNMASPNHATKLLSNPNFSHLLENVSQRIAIFKRDNPDQIEALNFNQIQYLLLPPKSAARRLSYYVPIRIYAKIRKQYSVESTQIKDLLKF